MKYRPEIDGLRALAVVPVIFFHAGFQLFRGGFVGVDVFFVISGYLITSILIDQIEDSRFSLVRFYERRARRILPTLLFVMLATLPFAWYWLMPNDLADYAKSLIATTLFGSNFLFWDQTGYFDTAAELKPLLHTWSLAVEEQYYILFPPLLFLGWRFGRQVGLAEVAALAIFSLVVAQWGVAHAPAAAYFLLPSRAWELLIGSFVAASMRSGTAPPAPGWRNALSLSGLFMIGLPIFAFDPQTPFPGLMAVPPVAGTALVILFATGQTPAARLLSSKAFAGVGLLAYSFYLWHQPIFALYRQRFGNESFDNNAFALIALAFGCALISFWLIERPFRKRATIRQLLIATVSSAVLVVGAALTIERIIEADKATVPSYKWALGVADPDLIAYAEHGETEMPCHGAGNGPGFVSCTFGDPDASPRLVLWGDSLAGAFLYGLDKVAREQGISGTAFIANGCPPVIGLQNTTFVECSGQTNTRILERIKDLPNVGRVLLFGNFSAAMVARNIVIDGQATSAEAVLKQVAASVSDIRAVGARTYLIEQGPTFAEPAAEYILQTLRRQSFKPLILQRSDHEATLADAKRLAQVVDGYITTTGFFCPSGVCPAMDDAGSLLIYDRTHMTNAYSVLLARFVLDWLKSELPLQDH